MKFRILLAGCLAVSLLTRADDQPPQPASPPTASAQPTPPAPKPVDKKLRVLVIGDSNTELNYIVGGLAKAMEQAYGFHGTGYRSLVDDVGMGHAGTYLPVPHHRQRRAVEKKLHVPAGRQAGLSFARRHVP